MLKFKIFILIIIVTIFSIGSAFLYFLYSNGAPITHGDIDYGIEYKKDLSLDIYYPTKKVFEKSPVILYFHGGAWVAGRKEAINFNRVNGAIKMLRDKGYAIISPEYTIAHDGKSPIPDCVINAFDAIKWIEDNANNYNFDLNNFGVFGESAGAHLAMLTAYAKPSDFSIGYPKPNFDYVVDIYGPNDLGNLLQSQVNDSLNTYLEKLPESLNEYFNLTKYLFGFDPIKDSIKAKQFTDKFSPIFYLNKEIPSTLIIHGSKDILVPVSQSIHLKNKLIALNVKNEFHILKGVNHAFADATDSQKKNIQIWIAEFIENQYNNNK